MKEKPPQVQWNLMRFKKTKFLKEKPKREKLSLTICENSSNDSTPLKM